MAALILGLDFYETEVYVGLWNETTSSSENFSVPGRTSEESVPLFVVKRSDGVYLAGTEGLSYSVSYGVDGFSKLYGRDVPDTVTIMDEKLDTTELLAGFLSDIFGTVRRSFAGAAISRVCITGDRIDGRMTEKFGEAMKLLGFNADQVFIINHANAFMRYMLCTDEIRCRQRSAAVEVDQDGAEAYYYAPSDLRNGVPTVVERIELAPSVNRDISQIADPNERIEAFEALLNCILKQNKKISCLYLSGDMIEDDAIKNSLRKYASATLKIFLGQNLYSDGACCRAAQDIPHHEILYDGQIFHTVTMEAYSSAEMQNISLLEAGTATEKAVARICVIPDECSELTFKIKDARSGHATSISVPVDSIVSGENKTNRLEVTVRFTDIKTLVIKVRDLGFGMIRPATYKVFEQTVMLKI